MVDHFESALHIAPSAIRPDRRIHGAPGETPICGLQARIERSGAILFPVSITNPFDPIETTHGLQEAVRTGDAQTLGQLLSDRFVFTSGRSITRLGDSGFMDFPGKAEWIAAAQAIDWQSFAIGRIRSVDLGDTVVIDCRLSQVVRRDGRDHQSSWVVTDVWTREGTTWRLVARHPEMV